MRILILNKREVETLLPMAECMGLMESALASLARGEVVLPLRPVLRVPNSPNVFAMMPAYSRNLEAIGAKLITVFPSNHGTGVDSHQGAVLLMDGARGTLLALMDASSITAIRTAAVSGVATKLLARKDAKTLAILGSGVQGRSHVAAMLAARPFENVRIWSRNADHAAALAEHVEVHNRIRCETVPDPATAVGPADVVCTVTASREPVLCGEWLSPGTHVNAVGASIPTARELDTHAVQRSRVFVDRRESALNEAGDILIPISEKAIGPDHIVAEIGELLTGGGSGGSAGRRTDEEITLFKSLGLAIEDLASAHYLYDRARREKAGTWVEF